MTKGGGVRGAEGQEGGCRFKVSRARGERHLSLLPSKTVFFFFLFFSVYFYTQRVEVCALLLERKELICRLATPPTPASKREPERGCGVVKRRDEEEKGRNFRDRERWRRTEMDISV